MSDHEVFSDPVVIPGPNPRSLFVDTETVDDAVAAPVDDDDARFCPTCHRTYGPSTPACTADGTALIDLPPLENG